VLWKFLGFNGEFEDFFTVLIEREPSMSAHGTATEFADSDIAVISFVEFKT
jgi:hypothetical protein